MSNGNRDNYKEETDSRSYNSWISTLYIRVVTSCSFISYNILTNFDTYFISYVRISHQNTILKIRILYPRHTNNAYVINIKPYVSA
jgi:hypothetical protein